MTDSVSVQYNLQKTSLAFFLHDNIIQFRASWIGWSFTRQMQLSQTVIGAGDTAFNLSVLSFRIIMKHGVEFDY